jgi:polar amino acid transport system substrate-binding protein
VPRLRRAVWVGVIGLLAITFGYLALDSRDVSLVRVRQQGVIRVGYAVEAPYSFVHGARIVGESPDVAARVVERMGIRRIAWVHPTFLVRQALLVRTGNPLVLHAYDDIAGHPTCRVAVVRSSFERTLLELAGVPAARVVEVPDSLTGRVAVESGLEDALALSSITMNWLAREDALGRTEVATPFRQPTRGHADGAMAGAFAFRPGEIALRDAWNTALASVVGTAGVAEVLAKPPTLKEFAHAVRRVLDVGSTSQP